MSDDASRKVLVSDFDGTITRRDFFQLVVERLLPAECPDDWGEYLAGRLTHFDALRNIFGSVTAGEPAFLQVVDAMELEPNLASEVEALRASGWRIIVASAGCDWYIRRLLSGAGVEVEVHANPGRIEAGRLVMERPEGSRFLSRQTGVDKVAIVRDAQARAETVAFAGDGHPDLAPALLVPGDLRFARGVLAEDLARLGEAYRPFDRWADVAREVQERQPGGHASLHRRQRAEVEPPLE
jgi:2-hydroxy-3-keto-5-methylthiopentenyl-1-phosphate phosphatase